MVNITQLPNLKNKRIEEDNVLSFNVQHVNTKYKNRGKVLPNITLFLRNFNYADYFITLLLFAILTITVKRIHLSIFKTEIPLQNFLKLFSSFQAIKQLCTEYFKTITMLLHKYHLS